MSAALATFVLPVAGIMPIVMPVAALLGAVFLLHRQHQPAYLEFVVWLWLLSPWLRRVVDHAGSFSEESPILLMGPLASLPAVVPAVLGRGHLHRDAARLFGVALVAFAYAFCVGLIRFGPAPAAVGVITWLAPCVVGLWVAVSPMDHAVLERALLRIATLGALVLGAYGTYQFFLMPEWDAEWMRNVDLVSIGRPLPFEVRVFSMLNAPAPFGMVVGALLVLMTASRSPIRLPAAVLGFIAFGLSLVRTAWLGMAVALVALVASGRARAVRAAGLIIVIPTILLLTVEGPAQEAVTDRFDATVQEADQDTSFSDRVSFYQRRVPQALRDVTGSGFGGFGSAAGQLDDDNEDTLVSVDSAVIESLLSMGALVGIGFLAAVVLGVVGAWRRGRTGNDLQRAAGAAVVALAAQLPLGNPLVSVAGIAFWVLLGYLARDRTEASAPPALTEPRRRSVNADQATTFRYASSTRGARRSGA